MTITWTIDQLERRAADGAVIVAHWRCAAIDGELQSAAIAPQTFEEADPTAPGFVPFEALDEATVVGWVKAALGAEAVDALEARLIAEVDAQRTPAVVPGLPWAPPAAEPVPAE